MHDVQQAGKCPEAQISNHVGPFALKVRIGLCGMKPLIKLHYEARYEAHDEPVWKVYF
jgi:hypothetical protein